MDSDILLLFAKLEQGGQTNAQKCKSRRFWNSVKLHVVQPDGTAAGHGGVPGCEFDLKGFHLRKVNCDVVRNKAAEWNVELGPGSRSRLRKVVARGMAGNVPDGDLINPFRAGQVTDLGPKTERAEGRPIGVKVLAGRPIIPPGTARTRCGWKIHPHGAGAFHFYGGVHAHLSLLIRPSEVGQVVEGINLQGL